MFMHSIRAFTLAGAIALTASTALAQGTLHRGNSADPETLDPHKTSTVYEANILRDLYEGLVIHDASAKVIGGVATSWSASADGTVWTFKLRSDAKWSNGDPVTAADFVYSLQRIMTPATGAKYANILYPIKNAEKINKGELKPEDLGVKAIDPLTLEITLESATPYFLELLTHQTGLPVHKASIEKFGADFVKPDNKVSNGPFKLAENVPSSHIKLVKNAAHYEAAKVKLDAIMFYPTEDRSAALRRFQAGELHMNDDVPTEQIKFIRETLKDQFRVAPYLGTYYFPINTKKAPFNDARVRNALSMVIDREFLAEEIWGGTMVPAYSFVPPGMDGYEPAYFSWKDKSPAEREEMAAKLLKDAGYGPGGKPIKLEIRYNTSENHKKTSIAIADMWKPFNVEVSLLNTDTKTHYAHLRDKGDYDIARAGWIGDYGDPQNFLFLMESDNSGFNYANWTNAEFDKLMDMAAAENDLAKRAGLLQKAEAIANAEEPNLSLLYYASKNLVSPKVEGWVSNLKDVHPSRYLSLKP